MTDDVKKSFEKNIYKNKKNVKNERWVTVLKYDENETVFSTSIRS